MSASLNAPPERPSVILIAEPEPGTGEQLRACLDRDQRKVLLVSTGAEFEKALRGQDVSLALLDLVLPDTDGRTLLARLREHPSTAALPVIVLSGRTSVRTTAECYALGAVGCYEKPVDPDLLRAAVGAQLQRESQIRRELREDHLTGLANRAAFCEAFERARGQTPLSLAFLDLDHFKDVNDTYGHATGDLALRRAATRFTAEFRGSDLVARWGGEEFVVLFPGTAIEGAARAVEGALDGLRQERFQTPDGKTFTVTFSSGVVQVDAGQTMEEAVAAADRLLYLAKSSGRNRVMTSTHQTPRLRPSILVAEDEPGIALLVRVCLEGAGFDVAHYADGESALAGARRDTPSLAILDVNMPGMTGLQVLRELRATPSLARLPVVMFTTLGSEKDIVQGFELGADDYVIKPLQPAEFVARIRRLLRRR